MEPGICIHIRKLIENSMRKVNQLFNVIISNKNINLTMCKLMLLSVNRPSIEYGSELKEGNKSQSLKSIILDVAK